MKYFKLNLYDELFEIYFYKDTYALNEGLYIGAICLDEDGNEELFGDISINIPMVYLKENEFIASNDSTETVKEMIKNGLLEDTNETVSSGYGIYEKVKLTKKFEEYVKY